MTETPAKKLFDFDLANAVFYQNQAAVIIMSLAFYIIHGKSNHFLFF